MSIGNILSVTDDQIHEFYSKNNRDQPIRKFLMDEIVFFERCDEIKKVAKRHLGNLEELSVTSGQIVEKIHMILEKAKSMAPGEKLIDGTFKLQIDHDRPEIIDGKFHLTPWKHQIPTKCYLCNDSFNFNIYRIINVKTSQDIPFQEINLHAIEKHHNFYFAGDQARYQMFPQDACKVLELSK